MGGRGRGRRVPKGEGVTANAIGSATEPARLEFRDAGPETDKHEPGDAPPPLWPDDERAELAAHRPSTPVDIAVQHTIPVVHALAAAHIEVDQMPMYSTHFIQASRG